MTRTFTNLKLEEISRFIEARMGLHFPSSKWGELERAFKRAAKDLEFDSPETCVKWFLSEPESRELNETLAKYLTIGETFFLREEKCFEILEKRIIPAILKQSNGHDKQLRIWSAGCSSGEEPYTIAILLNRMEQLLKGWEITILASDINPQALKKAKTGIYSEWSFRNTPSWFKENYFKKTEDGRYAIISKVKRMVDFTYINLVLDKYPSLFNDTNAIDVIFCRNVLMYFSKDLSNRVIERFRYCLLDDGWLFVSACETSLVKSPSFEPVNHAQSTAYKKFQGEGRKKPKEAFTVPKSTERKINTLDKLRKARVKLKETEDKSLKRIKPCLSVDKSYERALEYYESRQYEKSVEIISKVLTKEKNNKNGIALLCRIYANQGRLTEALHLIEDALSLDKLNPELHYLHGVILQEEDRLEDAMEALRRAIYLDKEMIAAHFALGNIALRMGKEKSSTQHFNNALSFLEAYEPEDVVPETEGMIASRFKEIIIASLQ